MVQKKLRQEGELIDSLGKLSELKEQRGGGDRAGKSGGGSGSGGLKNTLKRMKPAGKKKRQRNVTAPEISAEALKVLRKDQTAKPGAGRGLFGKKTSKEREGGSPTKKQEQETVKASPGNQAVRQSAVTAVREEAHVEPLNSTEEGVLSQRSELEYAVTGDLASATMPTLSHSKTDPGLSYHPDLSQVSLSSSIPEETLSTQSSVEAVPMDQLAPPTLSHPQTDSGGGGGGRDGSPGGSDVVPGEEGEKEEEEGEEDFRKGCPGLYDDYGDEQHKLNLKHVLKFLETCNESSPVDLSSLVDWDGWTLASKEVM